jgi:hypothetical protein
MSDAPPDPRPLHRKRIGAVAEGITFVLFIGVLTNTWPPIRATAAIWTILALALPLFWRGAFTFAIPRSRSYDELMNDGISEPRSLSAVAFMSFVLGITGVLTLWGADLLTVLASAAVFGGVLFAAVCAVDPPIRTAKQLAFLAVQCLLWGVGVLATILGLLVA